MDIHGERTGEHGFYRLPTVRASPKSWAEALCLARFRDSFTSFGILRGILSMPSINRALEVGGSSMGDSEFASSRRKPYVYISSSQDRPVVARILVDVFVGYPSRSLFYSSNMELFNIEIPSNLGIEERKGSCSPRTQSRSSVFAVSFPRQRRAPG